DRGIAEANATVCGYLFAAAKAGNISAIIFWLKTRVHWRERRAENTAATAADAEVSSPVFLVLPDNSRDPELTRVLREAQEHYFAGKPLIQVAGKSDRGAAVSEHGRTMRTEEACAAAACAAHLFAGNQGQYVSTPQA